MPPTSPETARVRPRTPRRRAGRPRSAATARAGSRPGDELPEADERDPDPVRPRPELVAQLVSRLGDEERLEEHAPALVVLWQERRAGRDVPVAGHARGRDPSIPEAAPGREVVGLDGAPAGAQDLEARRVRGVVERAGHAGEVHERGTLEA